MNRIGKKVEGKGQTDRCFVSEYFVLYMVMCGFLEIEYCAFGFVIVLPIKTIAYGTKFTHGAQVSAQVHCVWEAHIKTNAVSDHTIEIHQIAVEVQYSFTLCLIIHEPNRTSSWVLSLFH